MRNCIQGHGIGQVDDHRSRKSASFCLSVCERWPLWPLWTPHSSRSHSLKRYYLLCIHAHRVLSIGLKCPQLLVTQIQAA